MIATAEKTDREAAKRSVQEQIKELEDELKKTKYNKATQHHIGLVKAKLARLKEKQLARSSKSQKGEGFSVRKTGDATVVLVGFPSVGKSTLLNKITNAESKTASYAFTTLTCIPGLMEYKHAKIQVLDIPGIIQGAARGLGRGREVIAVVQNSDLVLILLDVFDYRQLDVIKKELYDANIRLNQGRPNVSIKKTMRGGISVASTVRLTKLDEKTIIAVLREYKIINADVLLREDITVDQLIDVIESNKKYVPAVVALNKIDMVDEQMIKTAQDYTGESIPISADRDINFDKLKEEIFRKLNFIRIFLKEAGKKADLEEPLIMKSPCTIKDVCSKLHKDFVAKFRFARIWGKSVKFDGQKIFNLDHHLADSDILQLYIK